MPQSDPSRTEKATPKRREEARDEGNVPKSEEVSKAATLLFGVVALWIFINHIGEHLEAIFVKIFTQAPTFTLNKSSLYGLLEFCLDEIFVILMPLFVILMIASYLSVQLQVGMLFTTEVFKPKLGEKFNIVKGMKQAFFSMTTVVNLLKNLFQILTIGSVAYFVIYKNMHTFGPLFYQNVTGVIGVILKYSFEMCIYVIILMLIIAIIHLIYTRWDYEENLKMTKDEVEDEQKQQYGNPELKREQRKKMQEGAQRRMMEDVPRADVVVTNPTQLAIALRYDPVEAPAPLVLAKGSGHIAERIKQVAQENDIPIKEDKALAQALYKSVEIGDVIPEELYQSVASILAQLYKFRQQRQ